MSICNSFAQSDFSQWRGPDRNGYFPGSNLLTTWPANGPKLLWKYDHLGSGFSSPAVTDHRIYTAGAVDSICNIFCFDPNGTSQTTVGTPLYRDGYLFTLNENGSILLKLGEGDSPPEVAWNHTDFFPLEGDPVLIGNRIYGKSQGKKYYCVDWLTGRTIGSIPAKAMVVTSIAADGLIYTYDIDGVFSLLKPVEPGLETVGSFTVTGGTKHHCSHPVISGGRLYIRHDNSLFVYQIAENEISD